MLALKRKAKQPLRLTTESGEVVVIRFDRNVKVFIEAPKSVAIDRPKEQ